MVWRNDRSGQGQRQTDRAGTRATEKATRSTRRGTTRQVGDYHSNSLAMRFQLPIRTRGKHTKRHVPCALREEVVLPVDVDHPVLEDALPLVLHTRDLMRGRYASSAQRSAHEREDVMPTLSYVQNTISCSAELPISLTSSLSESESSRSLLIASSLSACDVLCEGCGSDGCKARGA